MVLSIYNKIMTKVSKLHESKSEILEVKRLENIPIVLNSSKSDYFNKNTVPKENPNVVTNKKFKIPKFTSIFKRKREVKNENLEPKSTSLNQPSDLIEKASNTTIKQSVIMDEKNKLKLQIEQQQEIINKLNTQNLSMYNLFEVGISTQNLAKQNKNVINVVIMLTTLLLITIIVLVPVLVIKIEQLASVIPNLKSNSSLVFK